MVQAKPKLTLEEFIVYDDGTDTRYELENGALIPMPTESPKNTHIGIFLIAVFLQMGIPVTRLGNRHEIAVVSDEVKAREPDLIVHSEASAEAVNATDHAILLPGMPVPLLVIEVVSPGGMNSKNYQRDYLEKPVEYAARGIPEYWRIDSSRSVVTVLWLVEGQYQELSFKDRAQVLSPSFPDLALTANQILSAGA